MSHVKLALRALLKTPFVTTVAVVSLALGIGANAAIFSLFDQLLLRPLAVPAPERLVNLGAPGPNPGSQSCGMAGGCDVVFSYPMFRDLERGQKWFTGIAAHVVFGANLAPRGQTPINALGMLVSGSYFPVLRLTPAVGRLLTPADDRVVGGHPLAVLSYDYWATRLGSDPRVVSRIIVVNGQPLTIIGVAPRGFTGTTLGVQPKVFVPISMRGLMNPGWEGFESRRSYWAYLFARLLPGVSLEQATLAMNGLYHPIIAEVEAPLQKGMSEATLSRFKAKAITLADGRRGQSSVHKESKTPMMLLFALTALVLLIACANIANLLLARGAGRAMEMAVRLSLGASRGRVVTQLLVESCILAVLGGGASLLVAQWTLSGIGAIVPAEQAAMVQLGLQPAMLIFTTVVSLGTGLAFGMFPALHSTRSDLVTTIRSNAGQLTGARTAARFRNALVTAQIALSMALLVSAGLFIKSLVNVTRVDLGLNPDRVIVFGLSPELNGYGGARSRVLFQRAEEELRGLPGVTAVSTDRVGVLAGNNWGNDVSVEGFKKGPDTDANSRFNQVGPGFFHALGIPLLSGREFTAADAGGAPKVAVVNETFAKKFGLGPAAVGKHMSTGGDQLDIEIVGLVKDAKYSEVKDAIPPLFVRPYLQDSTVGQMNFYVRTSQDPGQLMRPITALIGKLDPTLPVQDLKTLPQQVKERVFLDRMISTLSAAFAALATLLAAVGLYGVLAYTVAQRTREIGVRMALGADARRVRRMVIRQVGKMALIGGVLGTGAALALGRAAGSLLFGLRGTDPSVMLIAAAVLGAVALGAGYLPALRASKVQPMQALRYE
ncbi:MAG TPA: ABC transporter permease [Gemmatimonadales bacterium]|jgi:predicted permease|nr:ABC transporter permease [Gemmatimonadales bacterium]